MTNGLFLAVFNPLSGLIQSKSDAGGNAEATGSDAGGAAGAWRSGELRHCYCHAIKH